MAANSRLIDTLPTPEQDGQLTVIGLGLPRQGTKSLKAALDILGIPTYHSEEAIKNEECVYWTEALRLKYKKESKPYSAEDFDKLLWRYEGIDDAPAVAFMEEHLANNPNAKVVLTKRDFDSWYTSISNTGFEMTRWRSWGLLQWFLPKRSVAWYQYACANLNILGGQGYSLEANHHLWTKENYRRTYDAHFPRVRALVPEERLLEFTIGEDGWEKLCAFLGKKVPNEPFPHKNQSNVLITQRWDKVKGLWMDAFSNVAKSVTFLGFTVVLVHWGFFRSKA